MRFSHHFFPTTFLQISHQITHLDFPTNFTARWVKIRINLVGKKNPEEESPCDPYILHDVQIFTPCVYNLLDRQEGDFFQKNPIFSLYFPFFSFASTFTRYRRVYRSSRCGTWRRPLHHFCGNLQLLGASL